MANNNDGQIVLGLDIPKTVSQINSDIKKLQNQLEQIKATGALDASATVKQINAQIASLQSQLKAINLKTNIDVNNSQKAGQKIGQTVADSAQKAIDNKGLNTDKLTQKFNKIQLQLGVNGDTTAQIEVLRNNFTKLGLSADEVKTKMSGVDTEVKTLQSLMNSGAENSAIVTQFEKLQTVLTQTQNNLKQTRSDYSLLATEQQRLSLANNIEAWNQKNTRATREVREENERYVASLRDLNTQMTKMQFGQIQTGFKQAENSMRTMNRLGLAFKDQWTQAINSFKVWLSASTAVMLLVNKLREMPKSVKELDTALVDLKKTTSMTASQLEDFYYAANDVAKQMGVTTKEIIDQASAWSRLGYSSEEAATQMAKLSSQFKLISPGMTSDEAVSGLVSIMKAYGIEVEDVLDGIMSKVNVVGNKFALSNSNIINMLQDSVSAMAEGNNTLEETIALETAAFEITQDENVGNGFKTVALRLRGINEETEELDDSLKTISGDLYDLTGVSVMQDADTFKSTYQILKEVSEVWDSLSDKTQADALELMFGKHRANIGSAVISNFDAAKKAMDEMANSAGNANAELTIAMDSIEYKANKTKEIGTGIAQNLFKREDMKSVLDTINSLGEGLDWLTEKLGLFGTTALIGGGILGGKNLGKVYKCTFSNCFEYALYA